MQFSRFLAVLALCSGVAGWGQAAAQNGGDFSTNTTPKNPVPKDTLIVKGAWFSASDSTTPTPEGGAVANSVFTDSYFGITYPLPAEFYQKFSGPPPSDSGRYVLAQIVPTDNYKGKTRGHILVTAEDMFFTSFPAENALQIVNFSTSHLQADYKMELQPTQIKIAGQPFTFYSYWSPVAGLHWYVLATEIRCHTVQFVLTSQDTKLLESLIKDMNRMTLPGEASPTGGKGGGNFPVCIKDYANDNVLERVNPHFPQNRYNTIPVRVIIDKAGKVKHVHILSAFPEQEKAIYDSLKQWTFRPYEKDGVRVEVETGLLFGRQPHWAVAEKAPGAAPANQ